MLLLRKDGNGSVHLFTFYLLYLSPALKSTGAVFYSVASFFLLVTVLWFSLYTGLELFGNFVVRGAPRTIMIQSSALLPFCTILEFCLGELGKAATSHPLKHKVTEQGMQAISIVPPTLTVMSHSALEKSQVCKVWGKFSCGSFTVYAQDDWG